MSDRPSYVLVTVSGGVAHVDYVPAGVVVEVRDFDHDPPLCYEEGDTGGNTGAIELEKHGDDWRRKDGARPEFDGEREEETT